ncbi:sll1956 [Synechocystis sp. PCC 6803]|uniref:Sll1956 protein n=1 Tax=Synechocystis sp. (strain ATCC 27184 / PCC 6803 / Kazusa) TaxID=1111708 RepID=P73813_SYNY3|nr:MULTISPECIES: Uma2 family endonuclease [unclassified Synechocystis]BAM51620.1 hypothetical protein BEST7613_2689 [Synechocystis sp. PCC 6803] [Bacillus subtilis BEST7613]AGF51555.1 hypothetical protein MYO_113030 [Synechocystis sp. PCC 6803]ALJ67551.1 hypothetical protein AOY38_06670 [Synechocystis sp. PCC 6803]AVP89396.1 Uma2 family endonuclease [Synechocystis sp. IPPAS B-1465]MBD2618520.1 Uma2 family endonuclease [Synechocystis sp. FACHB-898]
MIHAIETTSSISLEEFLNLPETKPAQEYQNGKIIQKPMPQGKHSKLQTTLASEINQRAESHQLAYAFTELRCTFGERSLVPDITVFKWNNIPLDSRGQIVDRIDIPPDWIIEILSPDQSPLKVIEKISFALRNGCQLGWLVSPSENIVMVFQGNQLPETKMGKDPLAVLAELQEWFITPEIIFGWLSFERLK